jgi:hypothetical protein
MTSTGHTDPAAPTREAGGRTDASLSPGITSKDNSNG